MTFDGAGLFFRSFFDLMTFKLSQFIANNLKQLIFDLSVFLTLTEIVRKVEFLHGRCESCNKFRCSVS